MNSNQVLGPWVQRFFQEYLVTERNVAQNTWKNYLWTFKLFVPFSLHDPQEGRLQASRSRHNVGTRSEIPRSR